MDNYSQLAIQMITLGINKITLQNIKDYFKEDGKNFNEIASKLKKVNVNLIPLNTLPNCGNLKYLQNPYNLIEYLIEKENASEEFASPPKHYAYK